MKAKLNTLLVAGSVLLVGCGAAESPQAESASAPAVTVERPDAPLAELRTTGWHCFGSGADAAIAAARVNAHLALQVDQIRASNAVGEAGGPLPDYGFDVVAEAGDPNGAHCVEVTRYSYLKNYPMHTN